MNNDSNPNEALVKPVNTFVKKTGLAARIDAAKKAIKDNPEIKADPKTCTNRLGLVIDDSGSMEGKAFTNAKEGCDQFLRNCGPDTSVAIYPLGGKYQSLTCEMFIAGMFVNTLAISGSTPLYKTLSELREKEDITRAVVFSDGEPDRHQEDVILMYIEKKIPIDSMYIGKAESSGYKELKDLSERTGGIFLHLTDSNMLRTALKYLAPQFRAMLMNAEVKEKIEKGEM